MIKHPLFFTSTSSFRNDAYQGTGYHSYNPIRTKAWQLKVDMSSLRLDIVVRTWMSNYLLINSGIYFLVHDLTSTAVYLKHCSFDNNISRCFVIQLIIHDLIF